MKIFNNTIEAASYFKKGSVIAIGNYDGIHYGHRAILKQLREKAKAHKLKTALLTFEPHPAKVLAPQAAPRLINTLPQKIELLKTTGIDALVIHPFNKTFAKTAPEAFFKKHLLKNLNAHVVYVGHDFTFGDRRSGNIETLECLGYKYKTSIHIISAQLCKDTLVSSSLIRKLIKEGKMDIACDLLTRPFFIDGIIVHGYHRGTSLGIHTANLQTDNELLPADGVYATLTGVGKKQFHSITNIGFNPTFDNKKRSIETHIFDFDKNIYDKKMRLFFFQKIRDEIRFATPAALVKQIAKDIDATKIILGKTPAIR